MPMEKPGEHKTKIYTEVMGKKELVFYANNWTDIIKAGWVFLGMYNGRAVMTRNGYISEFWEE